MCILCMCLLFVKAMVLMGKSSTTIASWSWHGIGAYRNWFRFNHTGAGPSLYRGCCDPVSSSLGPQSRTAHPIFLISRGERFPFLPLYLNFSMVDTWHEHCTPRSRARHRENLSTGISSMRVCVYYVKCACPPPRLFTVCASEFG